MPSFPRQCPRARWDTQCGARADHTTRDDHAADTCPPPTNPSPLLYSTTILSFKTRVIGDIGDRRNAPCKFSLDFINPPSLRHLQSKYRSQIALLFNCFECSAQREQSCLIHYASNIVQLLFHISLQKESVFTEHRTLEFLLMLFEFLNSALFLFIHK